MKKPEIFRQTVRIRAVTQISRFIATACAAIAVCFALNSQAVNILSNPGFDETPVFSPSGWQQFTTASWSSASTTVLTLSPPNALWMQGVYGAQLVQNVNQKISAAPGYTYSADAWFSQWVQAPINGDTGSGIGAGDDFYPSGSGLFNNNGVGYEDGWVEVQFLDSSGTNYPTSHILADYKSFIVNPAYVHNLAAIGATTTNVSATDTNINLNWFDCPVTNQYNPTAIVLNGDPDQTDASGATLSPGPTNSVANGILTAPPGTVYVQFSVNMCQYTGASGAARWDNCTLNQLSGFKPDVISGITPSAGVFQTNSTFSFNVQTPSAWSHNTDQQHTGGGQWSKRVEQPSVFRKQHQLECDVAWLGL